MTAPSLSLAARYADAQPCDCRAFISAGASEVDGPSTDCECGHHQTLHHGDGAGCDATCCPTCSAHIDDTDPTVEDGAKLWHEDCYTAASCQICSSSVCQCDDIHDLGRDRAMGLA